MPPQHVVDGGPDGGGDGYMRVRATGGGGPGSKLIVFNADRWHFDVDDAGIGAISMDLRNDSDVPLTMRLAFRDGLGRVTMEHHVVLEANSDWTHAVFPLDEVAGVEVTELRILHHPNASFTGAAIAGEFCVDNIEAVAGEPEPDAAVPEPDAALPDMAVVVHPDAFIPPMEDAGDLPPDAAPDGPQADVPELHPDVAELHPDVAVDLADAADPDIAEPDAASDDEGCDCSTTQTNPTVVWLAVLLLGVRRRRR